MTVNQLNQEWEGSNKLEWMKNLTFLKETVLMN